jgi:hypothetical protein
MLYFLFLFVIAFRDEIAYPWTYAAILGGMQVLLLKFFGTSLGAALIAGLIIYLYLGCVFTWLSRQTRFSLLWWVALFFAALPVTGRFFLDAAHAAH